MQDVDSTEEELNIVNSEIVNMGQQINTLKQWSAYSGDLESIGAFGQYTVRLISIRCRERDLGALIKDMEQSHISVQNLGCGKEVATLILAYHNAFKKQAESHLGNSGFEEAELYRL
ncbi:MAG: hypothetical protein U5N58_02950 [Actinomycetota bacterium]|nr:hypothetical protein [Actinomycetota bacterium]